MTMANPAPAPRRLAVVGHPLVAEENRLAFRDWTAFGVDLILPADWRARSLGHRYDGRAAAGGRVHALPVLASGRNSLFLWLGLSPLLERLRPDLIYCWEEPWCLSAWQVRRLAARLGIPLVFYSAENRTKRLPWPFRGLMHRVFRVARACVTPTAETAETIRAAGFQGPALVVPLWIRARRPVQADPEAKLLVYVGRLIPLKRVHLLVGALVRLPGYRLRIVGDGPERPRLEALARELGVDGRAEFLGYADNARLEETLDGASLLVLPTEENARQAEQFGKAALEGVSCGLPVLVSRTGNLARLAEAFPTVTARDTDTPAGMAEAVSEAMAAYPGPEALAEARGRVLEVFGAAAAGRALESSFAALAAPAEPPAFPEARR